MATVSLDSLSKYADVEITVVAYNLPPLPDSLSAAGYLATGAPSYYGGSVAYGLRDATYGKELFFEPRAGGRRTTRYFYFGRRIGVTEQPPSLNFAFKIQADEAAGVWDTGNGFIGFAVPGESSSSISFYLGVARDSSGLVSLVCEDGNSASVDVSAQWLTGEPNTVEIHWRASSAAADLYFNGEKIVDSLSVTSPPVDSLADLMVGAARPAANENTAMSWSFPVVTTQPLGAYQIAVLSPGADLATDFTPDSGSDVFSRVNEDFPDGDASYAVASEAGAKAVFDYVDANGNPLSLGPDQTVLAVRHVTQARTEQPDSRTLKSVYRKNGTDTTTPDGIAVVGKYARGAQLIENNPATGVAWQPDDFDDWSFGFQIVEE